MAAISDTGLPPTLFGGKQIFGRAPNEPTFTATGAEAGAGVPAGESDGTGGAEEKLHDVDAATQELRLRITDVENEERRHKLPVLLLLLLIVLGLIALLLVFSSSLTTLAKSLLGLH